MQTQIVRKTFVGQLSADVMKSVLKLLGMASSKVIIHFTNDGLSVKSMDDKHVMYEEIDIVQAQLFDVYELSDEMEVGTNLGFLLAWVERSGEDDMIIWKIDGEKHEITIVAKDTKEKQGRKLSVAVVKGLEKFPHPTITKPYTVELEFENIGFQNVLGDCSLGGNELVMQFSKDGIFFKCGELSTGEINIDIALDAAFIKNHKLDKNIKELRVHLDYLSSVVGSLSSFGDVVSINYGIDNPITLKVLEQKMGDAIKNLMFCIAPLEAPEE